MYYNSRYKKELHVAITKLAKFVNYLSECQNTNNQAEKRAALFSFEGALREEITLLPLHVL